MASYEEFKEELDELSEVAINALKGILLSKDRTSKHPPYSWQKETQDEHLHKALRHILTYMLQRDEQQAWDDEDHLALAITRLVMGSHAK